MQVCKTRFKDIVKLPYTITYLKTVMIRRFKEDFAYIY